MDLGSTDGTFEYLLEIANNNSKVQLYKSEWPEIDAGVFATLANDLIDMCQYDNVLYYQADEIWHEDLIKLTRQQFEQGNYDLAFWRIQYANNFQYVKWFPQVVHRVGKKSKFNFVGDGMNTDRYLEPKICSQYGGEYFPKWGAMGQQDIKSYVNEMICDVSLLGGFRDNIVERRALHAPFWHEEPLIYYFDKDTYKSSQMPASQWLERAKADEDWTKEMSPYNLPEILRHHIGKVRYELRPELLEALKSGTYLSRNQLS